MHACVCHDGELAGRVTPVMVVAANCNNKKSEKEHTAQLSSQHSQNTNPQTERISSRMGLKGHHLANNNRQQRGRGEEVPPD